MNLHDRAKACARVGILDSKAEADLSAALTKWFVATYVKGLTLTRLRSVGVGEAWTAYVQLIEKSDLNAITAVRKVDPNNAAILKQSTEGMIQHLQQLATGAIEPMGKPKKPPAPRKPAAAKKASKGGVLENSRH